jgi:hypothetical protein
MEEAEGEPCEPKSWFEGTEEEVVAYLEALEVPKGGCVVLAANGGSLTMNFGRHRLYFSSSWY